MLNILWSREKYMIKKAKTIEEVYAAFEPYPLNEKKQINDFFVDTYEARGTNAVKLMSLALEYSNNPYMKILFMGHRGSGKFTELSLYKCHDTSVSGKLSAGRVLLYEKYKYIKKF